MKSVLLAAIFGITGLVAILLAAPAEEKTAAIKIHPTNGFPDYGEPVVPQIEDVPPQEAIVPEPSAHYYSVQAKTEKPAPRRHMRVVRTRPNFFENWLPVSSNSKNPRRRNQFINVLVQPRRTAE
jgi:hypothetical protein